MKIRQDLNNEMFNDDTVTELLSTLNELINCIECFVDPNVNGNDICGVLMGSHVKKIINNPILKPLIKNE